MRPGSLLLRGPALLCAVLLLPAGCATTRYVPQVIARGELVLQYDGGFAMWAGGRRVARGLAYDGLAGYVRCVPAARDQAQRAHRDGVAGVTLAVLGASFGVAGLGGLYGLYDRDHLWGWLGGGIAVAVAGTVMAGISRKLRNSANGHAVDALNFYNDAVGSLGATCDDLRYPAPQGPLPELPPPPVAPQGQQPAPPGASAD